MVLRFLSFEDDSLPKLRQSTISLAATLCIVDVFALKLDLEELEFISSDKTFDPRFLLVPLLIYLIIRLSVVARWYIPLTGATEAAEDPRYVELTKTLKRYGDDLGQIEYLSKQLDEVDTEGLNFALGNLRENQEKLNDVEMNVKDLLESTGNYWSRNLENLARTTADGELGALVKESRELRLHMQNCSMLLANIYEKDKIRPFLADRDHLEKAAIQLSSLAQVLKENNSAGVIESVRKSFQSLKSELVTARRLQKNDTFIFSFLVPLIFGSGALIWTIYRWQPWNLFLGQ